MVGPIASAFPYALDGSPNISRRLSGEYFNAENAKARRAAEHIAEILLLSFRHFFSLFFFPILLPVFLLCGPLPLCELCVSLFLRTECRSDCPAVSGGASSATAGSGLASVSIRVICG